MTNKELKEQIGIFVNDTSSSDKIVVLEGDEFADGCIGISTDGRLIYSYERLVESISEHCKISQEAAMEHIEYNTIRSLPYIESHTLQAPIIIHEFSS